jgi:hypothetical protein
MPETTDWPVGPDSYFAQASFPITACTAVELSDAIKQLCDGREDTLLAIPLQLTLVARKSAPGSKEHRLVIARPKIFGEI